VDPEGNSDIDSDTVAERDVPKLVKMAKQMREASSAHQPKSSPVSSAPTRVEPEHDGAEAHVDSHHHASRDLLVRTREELKRQSNEEAIPGKTGRLPVLVGLLIVAAAGGAFVYSTSDTSPQSDTMSNADYSLRTKPEDTDIAEVAPVAVDDAEKPPLVERADERIDTAEQLKQQEAAIAEERRQEEARLAAELKAKREAEEARLAAELEAAKESERQRLQAELKSQREAEQKRLRAELIAAKRAKQRRLQAELEAARRAEQERVAAELEATRKAGEARLAQQLEARRKAEEAKQSAAEAAQVQAPEPVTEVPAETGEAKFSADPCAGPTARFLSTCR
jgi:DNA repair exonuclease SbcCD ATPase subunit